MIVKVMSADAELFEEFNYKKESHEAFEDFHEYSEQLISLYRVRKDFGKIIQQICKCCGATFIY